MSDEAEEVDAAKDSKPKRARGRRVGVQQMSKVFIPQLGNTFDSLRSILQKRKAAKTTEMRELAQEALGLGEIVEAGAKIAALAKAKYVEANRIEKEAEELERMAKEMVNASKIIELELEDENQGSYYRRGSGHTKRVKGASVTFTDDFTQIVDAAMLLQREHLDFEWLTHQKEDFMSRLSRSVTMEQAVAVLDEAENLVKGLEKEHKALLEKQEEKNARTERVCDQWEEGES